ncbi:hypothetical protein cyc_09802 [Cyclospora cayetanensis]|uniref:Secreted protein n=1 Tax=Cyclospora cayetanensis TaxID=88456 RepID=A0A1D3CV68_9EIME|nr:hypothetical protein cyc_09802 [Cyclospora cayetanensis]
MVSLVIPSLPILSWANAAGAEATPSETMRAEARRKTRESVTIIRVNAEVARRRPIRVVPTTAIRASTLPRDRQSGLGASVTRRQCHPATGGGGSRHQYERARHDGLAR